MTDKAFQEACDFVRALPPDDGQMDSSMRLSVYGLFKVATEGEPPNKATKSGVIESLKFDAWQDAWISCMMNQAQAKKEYVVLISTLRQRFSQQ